MLLPIPIPPILLIIVIMIIKCFILIHQYDSLKVIILITGSIFWLTINVIVVVVFVIKPTVLIKEVDVFGVLYPEPLAI